jgi:hypothetical protein
LKQQGYKSEWFLKDRKTGFVENHCEDCHKLLSAGEFKFLKEKTDIDLKYYCEEHRDKQLTNTCRNYDILISKTLCKNCEAENLSF